MRQLIVALLAAMALDSTGSTVRDLDQTKLVGRWSGTGTFFNVELQKALGSLPFVAQFASDLSGTGSVGGATLEAVSVRKTKGHLEVRAKLSGRVGANSALDKDHLVLLVTSLTDSTMQAEFHLKTNFRYDMRMREGRVAFTRVPQSAGVR